MASADLREELNCFICLSIYTDPVMLSCGHNFCQGCIESVLDIHERSVVYTCPECRAEYQEHPALQRSLKLCNIVERFLSNHREQEETEIFCTYCDSPVPADRTCLHCEASLWDKHLKKHSKSPEHVLMEPNISLEKRKCSLHKEILKYYCTEDAVCVCVSYFAFGDHKGHQVELLNEASEKKKVRLRNVLEKLTSKKMKACMVKETEKRIQNLLEHVRELQGKAAGVTERVTALIMDIMKQLEALEKRVLEEITRQEEEVLLQVSDLIQQLKKEKDELSMEMSHIEELCNMTDPITVLQGEEAEKVRNIKCGDKDLPAPEELDEVLISKLGIYLDYEAGCLPFYQLCDPIRHLHTFTATFTDPLHAAFYVYRAWVRIRGQEY
ncbi:E3 ubiquitin/ISG15 ligase TRIM25-like [Discoglossus pictus]